MLDNLFLQILNMSFTASIVILFVLVAKLPLKKAPKIFSYALWSVVLFRLVFPFSFESLLSLLPSNPTPISHKILYAQTPQIKTGIAGIDNAVNSSLPAPSLGASVNPMQIWTFIGEFVWLAGIAVLLLYSVVSLLRLQNRLKNAVHEKENVYLAEHLNTPFVLGIIRPKIYLPKALSLDEKQYILLHEQIHIRRFDHVIRMLSFLVLCVHWFNPLVWVAFILSGKDMEMSCDEAVIRRLGNDVKKDYSSSLLALATGRHIISGIPLAFGEGDTKSRIKNVLNYRKPTFWVIAIAVFIVVALYVGLMTNPKSSTTFNGSSYRVEEILYQAPMYSFGYTLDTAPQFSISSDYVLYSKQITDEDWIMHKGLNPYKISRQQLYTLFNPLNNKAHEAIDQAKLIYRADANDANHTFYLVIQLKNGDVLWALGYDTEDNRHIRWLFRLEEIGDRNGFSLTDQEVASMLGLSSFSAYCFSTYEMDNGLYIIGFLADGKTEQSDIGAGLFQFKAGEYQLLSRTIHKGQALVQDRIVLGLLIAPSNKYYDVVLSNNENLAEIRHASGGEAISEKVDRVNPSMTVIKLPETLRDTRYTFYDVTGQQIEGYIPAESTKK
ncbi:antirepressor regulating drug resistance protein [Desulfitobacterium dichloroeliminans LMG P-21439]|uniref:Antirepressor regulating drug resistance protein n=1 Tax=Desulfitobacterium dichloroeliminans (strain LMG P-21439 / DCA1) TaxID=871963 RepID=L0F6Y7_DESDL|nr:M56 family metallopeptidase [Desulfitobacterium dichloroeliminans]AGA68952.1 antirepressor regulating drug resistance protein [Desulfitobacterium dichloroeliminans LMG P-21439]